MSDALPSLRELESWLLSVSGPEWIWHVKYLSANDTYAKRNVHQGGPHVGKELLAAAFPRLFDLADVEHNPDLMIEATVDSHGERSEVRLIWYNSKRLTGQPNGRDEARLTRWGGRDAAIVEPDATGSLTIFAFHTRDGADADGLRVWRSRSPAEEDFILERVDGVEPGRSQLVSPAGLIPFIDATGNCALTDEEIPPDWRPNFPSGEQLVRWVITRTGAHQAPVDDRLMKRRDCEYEVFRSVERFHTMPRIRDGFASVDAFVEFAGSVTNRRKARAGRSLELHACRVFDEEGVPYSWTPQTENRKTPDFIFPSIERYHDANWPASRLRMLAAKTTTKDRWRQVLSEADRIGTKHLLTLQEGISVHQHQEMQAAGVRLVVPRQRIRSYPEEVQPDLLTLESFIADVRSSCGTVGE